MNKTYAQAVILGGVAKRGEQATALRVKCVDVIGEHFKTPKDDGDGYIMVEVPAPVVVKFDPSQSTYTDDRR